MRVRPPAGLPALVAASLLAAACSEQPPGGGPAKGTSGVLRSPAGAVAAEAQRPGDAEAGYRALLNEGLVTCGVPRAAFERVSGDTPEDLELPGRDARSAGLPYAFTAHSTGDGVALAVSNCLTCHAAEFNGELIVGLGNESLDFTRPPTEFADAFGLYVAGAREEAEWRKWSDRLGAIAPYVTTDTVGVNPAVNLTWALMAHRDPETLAWSNEPLIAPPPPRPLPVSVPPWWRMAKKHAMFYTTIGRGDHARHMVLASLLCTDSVPEAEAIDARAPDIRAFIASIEPPRWPFDVDPTLSGEGERVFAAACARCHGTYGDAASYPNIVVPLEEIGTDPALAVAATGGSEDRFQRWLARSFYGRGARAAPATGYIAPPLDAVWATAPYLHNGSVPDIATLLDSARRPAYWRRADTGAGPFDPSTLGLRYSALERGKDAEPRAAERKHIYDTSLEGYSNAGHLYGDGLSKADRAAVLEYLKTL